MPSAEWAPGRTICCGRWSACAGVRPRTAVSAPASRAESRARLAIPSMWPPLRSCRTRSLTASAAFRTGSTRHRRAARSQSGTYRTVPSGAGAVGARPEDLEGVRDCREAVLGGHLVGPSLDGRALDLDGAAATAAHEVVVVVRRAGAVDGLALVGAQDVDGAGLDHRLERPVDRGEAHARTGLAQPGVHRLGRGEVVGPLEQLCDRSLLPGRLARDGNPLGAVAPVHRVVPVVPVV